MVPTLYHVILGALIAGFSTIILNKILYQVFIEKTIEKDALHPICKQYRATSTHMMGMFVAAVLIYLIMTVGIGHMTCDKKKI